MYPEISAYLPSSKDSRDPKDDEDRAWLAHSRAGGYLITVQGPYEAGITVPTSSVENLPRGTGLESGRVKT